MTSSSSSSNSSRCHIRLCPLLPINDDLPLHHTHTCATPSHHHTHTQSACNEAALLFSSSLPASLTIHPPQNNNTIMTSTRSVSAPPSLPPSLPSLLLCPPPLSLSHSLTCLHLGCPSFAHTKWLQLTHTSCMKGVPGVRAVLDMKDCGRRFLNAGGAEAAPPPCLGPPPFLRSSDTNDFYRGDGSRGGEQGRGAGLRAGRRKHTPQETKARGGGCKPLGGWCVWEEHLRTKPHRRAHRRLLAAGIYVSQTACSDMHTHTHKYTQHQYTPTLRLSLCVMSLASGAGPSMAIITLLRGCVTLSSLSRRLYSVSWYDSRLRAVFVVEWSV